LKKLLEIQGQYIAAMKNHVTKSVELLNAAKSSLSNHIGSCKVKDCTIDKPCNFCTTWSKAWDDIDAYLEDNKEEEKQ